MCRLLRKKPPLAFISSGKVYRKDDDATHLPMFHQVEGIYVDENVSFSQLKDLIYKIIYSLFGEDVGGSYAILCTISYSSSCSALISTFSSPACCWWWWPTTPTCSWSRGSRWCQRGDCLQNRTKPPRSTRCSQSAVASMNWGTHPANSR